jgi:hypothetical protein
MRATTSKTIIKTRVMQTIFLMSKMISDRGEGSSGVNGIKQLCSNVLFVGSNPTATAVSLSG